MVVGVDLCAKVGKPAHGSMFQGEVTVMTNSAVVLASALTPSTTI